MERARLAIRALMELSPNDALVHRDGRDFFNLYYGVGSFPRFHEAFRRGR